MHKALRVLLAIMLIGIISVACWVILVLHMAPISTLSQFILSLCIFFTWQAAVLILLRYSIAQIATKPPKEAIFYPLAGGVAGAICGGCVAGIIGFYFGLLFVPLFGFLLIIAIRFLRSQNRV